MNLLKQIELTKQEFKQAYSAKTPTTRKDIRVTHAWLAQFPRISLCYAIIILIIGLCVGFDLTGHSDHKTLRYLYQKIFFILCLLASAYLTARAYSGIKQNCKR